MKDQYAQALASVPTIDQLSNMKDSVEQANRMAAAPVIEAFTKGLLEAAAQGQKGFRQSIREYALTGPQMVLVKQAFEAKGIAAEYYGERNPNGKQELILTW